jgi:hypothetical protein
MQSDRIIKDPNCNSTFISTVTITSEDKKADQLFLVQEIKDIFANKQFICPLCNSSNSTYIDTNIVWVQSTAMLVCSAHAGFK